MCHPLPDWPITGVCAPVPTVCAIPSPTGQSQVSVPQYLLYVPSPPQLANHRSLCPSTHCMCHPLPDWPITGVCAPVPTVCAIPCPTGQSQESVPQYPLYVPSPPQLANHRTLCPSTYCMCHPLPDWPITGVRAPVPTVCAIPCPTGQSQESGPQYPLCPTSLVHVLSPSLDDSGAGNNHTRLNTDSDWLPCST
ncbi:hypothetical protein XENTR_v10013055 [Xenopus tropicalis]|nr:hypothetical protein XENTR_v10013055 [Xenopus tropicalis]